GDLAGEFVSGNDRQRARRARPCGPSRNPGEFRVDDTGGVDPHEHLAFPGTWLRRLLVSERLGTTAGAQTDRFHTHLQTPVGRTTKLTRGRNFTNASPDRLSYEIRSRRSRPNDLFDAPLEISGWFRFVCRKEKSSAKPKPAIVAMIKRVRIKRLDFFTPIA